MNKAKYIMLIILSTLLYIAWLVDKKINAQDSFKYKPSVPIGSCVFLSLFSLALVYALPHI